MKEKWLKGLLILVVAVFALNAWAEVTLPALFCDNMVLQREAKVPVWGWADPGEKVTVEFADQKETAKAGKDGKWMVWLKPMEANAKPGVLKITRNNQSPITINQILVGDVWLCSGQSNMEMKVKGCNDAEAEIANGKYPAIRHFKVAKNPTTEPQKDCSGDWEVCTQETVGDFTAVGYFFGRKLHKELGIPVGLINSSWGGTRIEPWTAPKYLRCKMAKEYVETMEDKAEEYDPEKAKQQYERHLQLVKEGKWKGGKKPRLRQSVKDSQQWPSSLYNGMINPLLPYGIKGAIWYQGESNTRGYDFAYEYRYMLSDMIKNWRKDWDYDFPFFFVQLPGFRAPQTQPVEIDNTWAIIRESFMYVSKNVKNTGMAITIEIGDTNNIHPKNKQDVGKRLALQALKRVYDKDIVCSGPVYRKHKIRDGKVIIWFDHIGSGLACRGDKLERFAIAGKDQNFVWADAVIDGDTVVVSSDSVKEPKSARYAWAQNPEGCNLYNKEGLPASPFRTDDWKYVPPPEDN